MLIAAFALGGLVAAAPRDSAVIVDSGSTNTQGYKIEVWSDGTASLAMPGPSGAPQSAPKSFTIPAETTTRFFSGSRGGPQGPHGHGSVHEKRVVRNDDARDVARMDLTRSRLSAERPGDRGARQGRFGDTFGRWHQRPAAASCAAYDAVGAPQTLVSSKIAS